MTGYTLDQCALYSLKTKPQLASRIGRAAKFIKNRANKPDLYRIWNESKKSGGSRTIEAPREDLKAIQKRIADLLQRVLPPGYLFSPVKGRSYVENAIAHCGSKEVRLLDVANYFGNCSATSVFGFFHDRMKCTPDVAWLLTGLTTREGHLPQGSPCSPILSFYSCQPMWDKISKLVRDAGCIITIYVDDITVSGSMVPEKLIWEIKQALRNYGHTHQRKKERRHVGRAAEITGLMVSQVKFCVPHRHYKKMQAARLEARTTDDEKTKMSSLARARSLESQVQRLQVLRNAKA